MTRSTFDADKATEALGLLGTAGPTEGIEAILPIDTLGGPLGTVPELLFEKKGLIPALQHLLVETNANS